MSFFWDSSFETAPDTGRRRSRIIALAVVALAAAVVAAVILRPGTSGDYADHRYREHRAALAALAADYRAGRLPAEPELPAGLRSLCPSGFVYAGPTALFVQLWQDWRAESGNGLAYFLEPPTDQTVIPTADGDRGRPQREVGDGWWWVD
ncbi:MAG TPA: hypothetical protein VN408_36100 [Actinoplanes sp.]|nr:hypothetical protein [Actinoplanes sp.]